MNAILQCLIHCTHLQRFFLHDVGHPYNAYHIYRSMDILETCDVTKRQSHHGIRHKSKECEIVLASEFDKLFVQYFSSSVGFDVLSVLDFENKKPKKQQRHVVSNKMHGDHGTTSFHQGQPLLLSDLLHAVWKCQEMRRIARCEQLDAHEFLLAFIENVGKGIEKYYDTVRHAIGDMHIDQNRIRSKCTTKNGTL
jgi:ubiquitin C-terminal hydrolase